MRHFTIGSRAALVPVTALKLRIAMALVLVSAVALVYSRTLHNGFVYDDAEYLLENRHLWGGLGVESAGWALRSLYAANWHPLTWLSHLLDVSWYGLDPRGHHLTNLMLHAAGAAALFAALQGLTGQLLRSAFVALVFAVHPINVESVAWVSQRKSVLATLLWMLCLLAYLRFVSRPGRARRLVLAILFAFGLMAKPTLVTLPFVLLLLDFWPLGRWGRAAENPTPACRRTALTLLGEKAELFALSAASAGITWVAQSRGGAMGSVDAFPLAGRAANAAVSCCRYLGKAIWPADLAVFYPYPTAGWGALRVGLACAALAALTAVVIRERRRRPYLAVGWFWFLGVLVPVLGLVQVGIQSLADRYAYVPLVGIAIAVSWSAGDFARATPRRAVTVRLLAVVGVAALGWLAWARVGVWRDDESLFGDALRVTRDNAVAHTNLGMALARTGRLQQAEPHFLEAIRIRPSLAEAHNNLGRALFDQGKPAEALPHLQVASSLEPGDAIVLTNMGLALKALGRLDEALRQFELAVQIDPSQAEASFEAGTILHGRGDLRGAGARYEAALRERRDYVAALNNLGVLRAEAGRCEEAVASYRQALEISSSDPDLHNNLGVALLCLGRREEAAAAFGRALRIDAGHPDALRNRDALASGVQRGR